VLNERLKLVGRRPDGGGSRTLLEHPRAKSPQRRLQAVFLFDEADIYLPAGMKQPATKAPMEDLLKRARSAGVGVFLASQSPERWQANRHLTTSVSSPRAGH
jgi:DNA helicase HerA-like ATPase